MRKMKRKRMKKRIRNKLVPAQVCLFLVCEALNSAIHNSFLLKEKYRTVTVRKLWSQTVVSFFCMVNILPNVSLDSLVPAVFLLATDLAWYSRGIVN